MRIEVVPVTGKHIKRVAANMRPCDVAEIWGSNRWTPRQALEAGMRSAAMARTALVNGEPACIFGVTPASLLTGVGTPWMLATPKLHRIERAFVRLSRPVVDSMQALFPLLVNYVDNRNASTLRWLAWLGFELGEPEPYGPDGLPFRKFQRSR